MARLQIARRAGRDGARTEGRVFAISRLQRHTELPLPSKITFAAAHDKKCAWRADAGREGVEVEDEFRSQSAPLDCSGSASPSGARATNLCTAMLRVEL